MSSCLRSVENPVVSAPPVSPVICSYDRMARELVIGIKVKWIWLDAASVEPFLIVSSGIGAILPTMRLAFAMSGVDKRCFIDSEYLTYIVTMTRTSSHQTSLSSSQHLVATMEKRGNPPSNLGAISSQRLSEINASAGRLLTEIREDKILSQLRLDALASGGDDHEFASRVQHLDEKLTIASDNFLSILPDLPAHHDPYGHVAAVREIAELYKAVMARESYHGRPKTGSKDFEDLEAKVYAAIERRKTTLRREQHELALKLGGAFGLSGQMK